MRAAVQTSPARRTFLQDGQYVISHRGSDHPVVHTSFSVACSTGEVASAYTLVPDVLKFRRLVAQWREERGATSSITKMAMCLAYQKIIAMGEPAVPLILHQLASEGDEPDLWFWALQVLTGEDPVPDEARGDMKKMAECWLGWAGSKYGW